MSLNLVNELFNNLKENKFVQNFIQELSNYLENSLGHTSNTNTINSTYNNNFEWNNLSSDDLTLYNYKIITKFRDKMLLNRRKILENYAKNTNDKGEMFYIYNINTKDKNSYNLSNCSPSKSHEIITKKLEELPSGSNLGSILRKQGDNFVLDTEATKIVGKEINSMIKQQIEEQKKYFDSVRIDGHTYEVGEKSSGRIWLYDLDSSIGRGSEEIEEIDFPKDLYETAKQGDLFIYQNGKYHKKM